MPNYPVKKKRRFLGNGNAVPPDHNYSVTGYTTQSRGTDMRESQEIAKR